MSLETEAELLRLHIEDMFVKWGQSKPLRAGLHASSVLVPESEWCVRRHVLGELFPDKAARPDVKPWDFHQNAIFLHGWTLHEKYQMLFNQFGDCIEVETAHYDETRALWFTPDAILRFGGEIYVVEIKGYKTEEYEKHTDKPPEAAHLQANLYCHLLGIQKAIVLVEHKGTQEFKLWVIEYDREMVKPYLGRMYQMKRDLAIYRQNSRLPARICQSRGDALARKCPMKDCCFFEKMEVK